MGSQYLPTNGSKLTLEFYINERGPISTPSVTRKSVSRPGVGAPLSPPLGARDQNFVEINNDIKLQAETGRKNYAVGVSYFREGSTYTFAIWKSTENVER